MTDLQYFKDLHADAKSFHMKAFYESFIRQLNGGMLSPCQHMRKVMNVERSYGSTYVWYSCSDCGTRFNQSVSEPW